MGLEKLSKRVIGSAIEQKSVEKIEGIDEA